MKSPQKRTPGTLNIRYQTPIAYDSVLKVLETDYKNYAVIWSCNQIGPFGHADSFWVMTRERIPSGPAMQRAYGVLDKFKISRTFFISTDQTDCETVAPAVEAIDPTTQESVTETPEALIEGEDSPNQSLSANELLGAANVTSSDEIGPEEELIHVGEDVLEVSQNETSVGEELGGKEGSDNMKTEIKKEKFPYKFEKPTLDKGKVVIKAWFKGLHNVIYLFYSF